MPKTLYESKLFEDRSHAERALERLHALGYGREHISLIVHESDLPADQAFQSETSPLAVHGTIGETGVLTGGIAGGILGAVIAVAIAVAAVALTEGAATPLVIGPVVAAIGGFGAGAVGGSIVGGLLELGLEAEDWRVGLRNGGVVVIVAVKSTEDQDAIHKALMGA